MKKTQNTKFVAKRHYDLKKYFKKNLNKKIDDDNNYTTVRKKLEIQKAVAAVINDPSSSSSPSYVLKIF